MAYFLYIEKFSSNRHVGGFKIIYMLNWVSEENIEIPTQILEMVFTYFLEEKNTNCGGFVNCNIDPKKYLLTFC